ncbi:MAG: glycosyltransferase family 4 protein [Chthoniobacterales bacterium]|nr:glycosyltransferase family 4 protein [Chthoniobacterales bacterium]
MVLLIGNYPADQQESMRRFATMMLRELTGAGVPAELIQPRPLLGNIRLAGGFVAKWLGYIDKFLLFPGKLRARLRPEVRVVHICDHSNAMYGAQVAGRPVVVSCHDLLAVRGALGEVEDTPASFTGKILQRWIVAGLRRATAIACASRATLRDAERLVGQTNGRPLLSLIHHGINHPYKRQPPNEARARLAKIAALDPERPFLLHVGSNLRMKNREGALRIFALTTSDWNGQLVFAGQKLTSKLRSLGKKLGVLDRVVEIEGPEDALLEGLYSSAMALLYPSRFEGFGWPIIEAQACGCPVLCAAREPMSEVGGDAALTHDVEDEAAFARSILRLTDPGERARWSERSLQNVERFRAEDMIAKYIALYRELGVAL